MHNLKMAQKHGTLLKLNTRMYMTRAFIEFRHDALRMSQDDSQKLYTCSFVTVSDLVSDMRDQSFPYTSYQRNLESAYLCSALKYSCTKFSISILTPTTHNTHLSDSTFSAGIKIVSCSLCLFCYSGLYLHSANKGIHMSALQVL